MNENNTLHKSLNAWHGTAMMLNTVLGAGLLILPGLAVKQVAGLAFLAWVMCALGAIPLLTVFIILGRRYPNAGGPPHFAERAFGPLAYLVGSFVFLGAVAIGLPSIAITGGYYSASAFGGSPHVHAAFLIFFALFLNVLSVEISGQVSQLLAWTLLAFLSAIAAISLPVINPSPSAPPLIPDFAVVDPAKLPGPFVMIFFAFTGWEVAASLAEEFKDPRRDFPLAMITSFIVASCVIIILPEGIYRPKPRPVRQFRIPVASIFGAQFGNDGRVVISAIAVVLIAANLSAAIYDVSRLVFALARESVLPEILTIVHRGQPIFAVAVLVMVLLSVVAADSTGLIGVDSLLSLSGQNFFILYGFSAAALVRPAPRFWEKSLGLFALSVVSAVSVLRGGALIYPMVLATIAWIVPLAATHPQRRR